MMKQIGITMRVIDNQTYFERRDALSHDWANFCERFFPGTVLVPLVNNPKQIENTLKELSLDAIILSNGNDLGEIPERDETETKVIEFCLETETPLLGVCRGMQMLNHYFGGKVEKEIKNFTQVIHVAKSHDVTLSQDFSKTLATPEKIKVNSYHDQGVLKKGLSDSFQVFAEAEDGIVEGMLHKSKPILGIQWHPERENPGFQFDRKLITEFFKEGAFWLERELK